MVNLTFLSGHNTLSTCQTNTSPTHYMLLLTHCNRVYHITTIAHTFAHPLGASFAHTLVSPLPIPWVLLPTPWVFPVPIPWALPRRYLGCFLYQYLGLSLAYILGSFAYTLGVSFSNTLGFPLPISWVLLPIPWVFPIPIPWSLSCLYLGFFCLYLGCFPYQYLGLALADTLGSPLPIPWVHLPIPWVLPLPIPWARPWVYLGWFLYSYLGLSLADTLLFFPKPLGFPLPMPY